MLLQFSEPVCIQEGDVSFVNLNALDDTFMSVTNDISTVACTKDPLPEITFEVF